MGHPKKQRKKFATPKRPFDRARLERESKVAGEFGLRRKREVWRAESILRDLRQRARALQAKHNEQQEKELVAKLNKMGIRVSKLDDVLTVRLEDILSRRLQTIVHKKGLANTQYHARQLITHGHISINEQKMLWPSYIVKSGEDDHISLSPVIAAKIISAEKKESATKPAKQSVRAAKPPAKQFTKPAAAKRVQ
jgi:small subunit ribosomal protein S4